jgi:hypothetical protein
MHACQAFFKKDSNIFPSLYLCFFARY